VAEKTYQKMDWDIKENNATYAIIMNAKKIIHVEISVYGCEHGIE